MQLFCRLLFISSMITTFGLSAQQKITGKLTSLDPEFNELIAPNTPIQVLGEGFDWAEGPVWMKERGFLLFSDVPKNTIYKWKEGEEISTFLNPSGYTGILPYSKEPGSNGLTVSNDGQLILCEHGDRRISIMPFSKGGKKTLADSYEGKRFNSPNDVIQHSSGAVYFTDPPYGLPDYVKDASREIDMFGVYRIGTDGVVTAVIKDLQRPNGLAFSPEESILYVAQSDPNAAYIMAYDVNIDGSLRNARVFYDATPEHKKGELKGLPDGLKIDNKGNIFSTGPGGVMVISKTGKLLGRIETGQATANCAWGGDGSVLYITADSHLLRIRTKTKGAGW